MENNNIIPPRPKLGYDEDRPTNVDIRSITQFGDCFLVESKFDIDKLFKELEPFKNKWAKYNPRKDWIKRDGLCILNERGECGPGPALDSLGEWNKEHKTHWREPDFNVPTELYKSSSELQRVLGPIIKHCVRTHLLRLPPGGYFPPHRDHIYGNQDSFRLIYPIENGNPPTNIFLLEDRILNFEMGKGHIIDTTKVHTLFNSSPSLDSIFVVCNVTLNEETVRWVQDNLSIR